MPHAANSSRSRLAGAVALSIGVHLVALTVFALVARDAAPANGNVPLDFGTVAMVPVTEPDPPEPPPRPEAPHVSLPEPEEEEAPEDPTVMDRYDRTVEREEVRELASSGPARPAASPESARRGSRGGEGEESVARAIDVRPTGPPASDEPAEDASEPGELGGEGVPTRLAEDGEEGSEGEGVPDAPSPRGEGLDLTVFRMQPADAIVDPGGGSEFLELEEGERTLVNSARSIYWSFFERIRRQVQAEWEPARVYRLHDPHGVYYPQLDRYTLLEFELGPDGALVRTTVERQSGLDFLDAEAVRAMRAAAPFPNVPEGLKDDRGHVTLRFGFLLSLDGATRVRRVPF